MYKWVVSNCNDPSNDVGAENETVAKRTLGNGIRQTGYLGYAKITYCIMKKQLDQLLLLLFLESKTLIFLKGGKDMKGTQMLKRNSPLFLTCLGAAGVIMTTVMAVRATPRALRQIENDSRINHDGDPKAYTKTEAVKSSWKFYIPATVIGIGTMVCIFSANILGQKQQASIISAYALINSAYKEYQCKVKELYGEETHNAVLDAIAVEKCKDVEITASIFSETGSLDFDINDPIRLFYDIFSNRYFETSAEKVIQAEYHLNRNFILKGYVSLNEFYEFLGLEPMDYGNEIGWSIDDEIYWIDFGHHKAVMDDGLECCIIDMLFRPSADF